jgi:hypothetical protein
LFESQRFTVLIYHVLETFSEVESLQRFGTQIVNKHENDVKTYSVPVYHFGFDICLLLFLSLLSFNLDWGLSSSIPPFK